jgi:hypothetical protein
MRCRTILAAVLLTGILVGRAAADEPKADPVAEAMMRKAHLARSGWDASFPGFKAELTVAIDGRRQRGTVKVAPDGAVDVQLPEGPAKDWATEQLESITMHRAAGVRDRYEVSFADDVTDHPLGRLIKFHDSTSHSVYRIQDDVITEVHRQMGKVRFTISVTDVIRNDQDQTLPRHFNVSYWDAASGALESNHDFTDEWIRVGKFDLPKTRLLVRTAKNLRQVSELRLSGHDLLSAKPASGQ